MKIYTRTGDGGETSLFGGARVSKGDARVEAYGEIDELNAWLGWVGAALKDDPPTFADIAELLETIQRDLFAVGARLADPTDTIQTRITKAALRAADVERLERAIDSLEADLPAIKRFILPGGGEAGARLHLARAVCRRAERRVVTLRPPVDPLLLQYVNRLSDLLFVMARAVNHRSRASEIEW